MERAPPHLSQAEAILSHFTSLDLHQTMMMTQAGTEIYYDKATVVSL